MIRIEWDEKDIEDYLCKESGGWRKTNLNKIRGLENVVIIGRQVSILGFFIDILAYDKKRKTFIIVELKKDDITPSAYVQAIRYYNCLNCKYNKQNIEILLIGKNVSKELTYTLENVSYRGVITYYRPIKVYYTLYNLDFERGIDFNWRNTEVEDVSSFLYELENARKYKNNSEWQYI